MFKALFIPTGNSGLMWWRIQSYVEAAWRNGLASFQNPLWKKDLNGVQPWQTMMTDDIHKAQPVMPDDKYDVFFVRSFVPMIESGCIGADAVVFQYGHLEGAAELFDAIKIKFPNLPLLTEIDDNILSVPQYNEAAGVFDPRSAVRRRVIAQMRASDAVIVSTPYLKEIFSEFNATIYVVPNAIDFKQWDKLKGKKKPGIRIGWAGGSGHEGDFEPVADAIKNVLARHKDARLVLVNGPSTNGIPKFFQGVERIEHHPVWTPILKYPKMMMEMDFDIGIAPVVDSAFNRGKSNLKWIENAAMGIPTVCSNVGHLAETVNHGVDGFLAETPKDFEDYLEKLVVNRKLRTSMGMAANERVRRDFNVDNVSAEYVSILREVARKKADDNLAKACEVVSQVPQDAITVDDIYARPQIPHESIYREQPQGYADELLNSSLLKQSPQDKTESHDNTRSEKIHDSGINTASVPSEILASIEEQKPMPEQQEFTRNE